MKKIFSFVAATLFAATMWAAVGPQSVAVSFSGTDEEGWTVSNSGSTSVAGGLLNVTMGVQKAEENKYRADLQYTKAGDFSMDKTKDVVWAIKLSEAFVGNLSFEFQYVNSASEGKYISQSNIKSTLSCEDGSVIYYTDLSSKYGDVQDGEVAVNVLRFKMADAVFAEAANAKYSVDWIASFSSLNDLKSFVNWNDDKESVNEAYFELLFRPKADGSGYDSRKNGFNAADVEFEGNYKAGLFAIEYFLVENLNASKDYKLVLTATGNNSDLAVWNFPYQVNYEEAPADIITKATAVVGIAPRAESGAVNEPAASAKIADGAWTFTIPGSALTVLATHGDISLIGLLVSSKEVTDSNKKGKFASCANTEKAHPTLTVVNDGPSTAIDNTNAEFKAEKLIIDGRVVIRRGNRFFDLTGREL